MSKLARTAVAFLAVLAGCFWVVSTSHPNLSLAEKTSQVHYTSVELSENEKNDLKRLGLTPKKPVNVTDSLTGITRTIHGRFVHVTDFHPDNHYKAGSDHDDMCHSGKGKAGKYGDAILGCDSPMELVQGTIDWIADNLKDKIDFVVWTGDNMRHDNDRKYPRTETSIFEMNDEIAALMSKKLGTLPIPSLGNNDVYPHNLFAPGPTLQTREFFKIWRPFVPQLQLHIFNRGAYFFQEVIPNQLAILSINTLYLFQSNPLVDSCDKKKDPGYKSFLWLGFVLKEMRKRGMKVWLTGHVPPNAKNYDISCLRKYIVWSHEYRDVIIGGLYGHMNIDHFIPLDSVQAYKLLKKKYTDLEIDFSTFEDENEEALDNQDNNDLPDLELEDLYKVFRAPIYNDSPDEAGFHIDFSDDFWVEGGVPSGKVEYMNSLRESLYALVKKKKLSGLHSERYSVVHVSASVVPTFNPGVRVWEYNITELHDFESKEAQGWDVFFSSIDSLLDEDDSDDEENDAFAIFKKKKKQKKDKTIPPKMPANAALGPGYVPQLFTPERYVQYYLDLVSVNSDKKPFEYEIEYATDDAVFGMKDATTDEWLKVARSLGEPIVEKKKKTKEAQSPANDKLEKLWKAFLRYTFVSSDYENLGYG